MFYTELRVLQYFLAVTREQSITGAADALHLSQPTLSRQLHDLEEELGKQLFIRGKRQITLTEEGMLLRKRAQEILELVQKAEDEISLSAEVIAGDITVGAGETDGMRLLAKAMRALQEEYPLIRFHIVSGDRVNVAEELDRGLLDFGLLFGQVDVTKYEAVPLPYQDTWGVLMRKDAPLAKKEAITAEDLLGQPLLVSRQALQHNDFRSFFGSMYSKLNIVGTFNLIFNGSLMVDEDIGYALSLDKLINVTGNSNLCFRPLTPTVKSTPYLVWKKYQVFTKAAAKFLQTLQETIGS